MSDNNPKSEPTKASAKSKSSEAQTTVISANYNEQGIALLDALCDELGVKDRSTAIRFVLLIGFMQIRKDGKWTISDTNRMFVPHAALAAYSTFGLK